jgi:hypothetical protein
MIPKNLIDDNGALFRRGKTVDNPVPNPGMRRGRRAFPGSGADGSRHRASAPHLRTTGYAQVFPRPLWRTWGRLPGAEQRPRAA